MNIKPAICIFNDVSSFSGFLFINSIIYISIFPPSSGGIGIRFVIPSDNEITDNKYIKSVKLDVCDTIVATPTGPAKSSIVVPPVKSILMLSSNAPI